MAARRWLDLLNFAVLLLVAGPRPVEAQTTNRFAGAFDELFSNGGKVTPIFTRPDAPAPPTSIDVSPPPTPSISVRRKPANKKGQRALSRSGLSRQPRQPALLRSPGAKLFSRLPRRRS